MSAVPGQPRPAPIAVAGWHRAGEALRWSALGLLLLGTLALLALPVLTAGMLTEKNYNEGWNAYHAARAAAGAVLYDDDLRRIVNYPFLSFYLVAALAKPFGGVLFAGRALSVLGLVAVGACCLVLARRAGATQRGAWFAAAASLGFAILAAPGWIAADDPQFLADALMLAALATYAAGRDDARHLAAAAALVMLGGFTKHTLVAVPLAITFDIAARNPRRAVLWAALCLACFTLLLAATYLVAGGDFFARLLSPRAVSWDGLVYHPRKFLIMFKLPLAASLVWLALLAPRGWRLLLGAYLALSLAAGTLFAAGDGVSFNTMLDAAVALGLVSGLALDGFRPISSNTVRLLVLALPVLLAWPLLVRGSEIVRSLAGLESGLAEARADAASLRADADFVAAQPGDAICESLLLCFAAGKTLVLDPFNARELILAGRLDEQPLVQEIAARRYGAVELRGVIYDRPGSPVEINPSLYYPARFTEPVLRAIADFYHVARVSGGRVVYLPNR